MSETHIEKLNAWLEGLGDYGLRTALPMLMILMVGMVVIRIVTVLTGKLLAKSKLEKAAHSLIKTVVRTAMYLMLLLTVASGLGIDVTGVIALASVLTLAVSLSVQNMLTNVISGFTLLYTKPFRSGDWVEIAGQSGAVQEIGLTYTKLATGDNKLVSIPNGSVTSAEIVNYTVTGTRRLDITVGVSYDCAVDDVLAALKEAGSVDTVLPEKGIFTALSSYSDSSMDYVLRVWVKTDDYWNTKFEINRRIKAVFDQKGIELTYPHLNVHLDK